MPLFLAPLRIYLRFINGILKIVETFFENSSENGLRFSYL